VLILCVVGLIAPAGLTAQETHSVCPFCRSEQADEAYICTHCGRLFRVTDLDPQHRFWGDAFYIFSLPTISSRPDLIAEVGSDGLIREQAEFDLGDRYEYEVTSKGVRISAEVYSRNKTEVAYSATVEDSHDEAGRLDKRVVHGELRSKPRRFLYRLIDFRFDGDRFESADVGSWIYSNPKDWEKHPTNWIRHTVLSVRFEYANGQPSKIHAERKKGVRDLRGNADYAAVEGFSETVDVAAGLVTGFGPPELRQGDTK
jgi:hypothetical protein